MNTTLKSRIIKIGNSKGVRIPKAWLAELGVEEEVELAIQAKQIIIRSITSRPRHNWAQQFRAMAARGDDKLLDGMV
jgi:antitoxin MazE